MCHVLDCHKQLAVKPSCVFVRNLRASDFELLMLWIRLFCVLRRRDSCATVPQRHWSPLARSFSQMGSPTAHAGHCEASTTLIKENIGDLDDSFIPRGNFSEKMGFRWAHQYWQWAKIKAREDLCGKTRVVRFRSSMNLLTPRARGLLQRSSLRGTGSRGFKPRVGFIQSQFAGRSQDPDTVAFSSPPSEEYYKGGERLASSADAALVIIALAAIDRIATLVPRYCDLPYSRWLLVLN